MQFRISMPLILVTVAALAAFIVLTVIGWLSFERLGDQQDTVNNGAEALSAALGILNYANSLAAVGSKSTDALTPEDLVENSASIAADKVALAEQLALLKGGDYGNRAERIQNHADSLVSGIELIEGGRPELIRLIDEGNENYRRLYYGFNKNLDAAIVTSVDDQIYYMMTGYRAGESTQPDPASFSMEEFLRYRYISELGADARYGRGKLLAASSINSPRIAALVQEEYETASQRMKSELKYLSVNGGPALNPEIIPLVREMLAAGEGEGNLFETLQLKFRLISKERKMIAANAKTLGMLHGEVDALVEDAQQRAASADSSQTMSTARALLLALGVVGIVGTLLAGWHIGFRPRAV